MPNTALLAASGGGGGGGRGGRGGGGDREGLTPPRDPSDARVNVKRLSDWKRQLKQAQFDMLAQGGRAEDARLKKQGGQRSAFSEEFITKAAEQLVEAAKTGNAIRKKAKRKQLDSAGCLIAAAKTLPSMLADENAWAAKCIVVWLGDDWFLHQPATGLTD